MPANVLRLAIARERDKTPPPEVAPWRTIAEGYAPPATLDLAGRLDRVVELLELLAAQTDARQPTLPIGDAHEELIDQAELGELLKLSVRTVRRMETRGELPPSIASGRRHLYLRDEIDRWLKHGRPSRKEWEARGRK